MFRKIIGFFFLVFIVFFGFSLDGKETFASTTVSANISTNTTWNAAGSPYDITGGIQINSGAVLTIDASGGAVDVNFCSGCYLWFVSGTTMNSNGTVANTVTFKHSNSTSAGSWNGIFADAGSTITLDYSAIKYSDMGLACRGGTCSSSNSLFETNNYGIMAYDNSSLTTVANTFNKNYYPLTIEPEIGTINLGTGGNADILGSGANTNSFNVIAIGPGSSNLANCTANVCTIPQRTFAGITNIPYQITQSATLAVTGSDDTLVIDAGVIIKFFGGEAAISVYNGAKIDINGTSGNEVVFTSWRDDTIGGDTNNDGGASTPSVNNWNCLYLGTGANTIDFLKVYYSINGVYANTSNTTLTINDSLFQSNSNGITSDNLASVTTARNTFYKNQGFIITYDIESTLNLGTGGNADILGTGANLNSYNAIGIGGNDRTANNCPANTCTLSQRTFGGIANIPYLLTGDNISVSGADDTLVIDAGVIVKGWNFYTNLYVQSGAKLDINGTLGNEVIFTSVSDDTYGGDTNNDGGATDGNSRRWSQLILRSSGNTIDYLKMYYSAYGINVSGAGVDLVINDSTYESNSNGIGVYNAATLTTNRNTFNKNGSGPIIIDLDQGALNFGTGGNADILGTGANLNSYNAIQVGLEFVEGTANNCPSNICSLSQRTFAGISNIPYLFAPINFQVSGSDDTLVVDAGVVVKFWNFYSTLSITNGAKIDVNGTLGNEAIFTSVADDTFGGDTNNDAGATNGTSRRWAQLAISTSGNTIDYLKSYYSGYGIYVTGSGANLVMNDSTYESHTAGLGAYNNGTLTTARNTFNKNSYSPVAISLDSTLNFGTGGNADSLGTGANANTYNGIGVGVTYLSTGTNNCPANTCTMNQKTFAGISNIPYVFVSDTYNFSGSDDTLAIDPGVVIKTFGGGYGYLNVYNGAKLDVNGTLGNPVIFTSAKDDSYGGDTNNDASATSPAQNDWNTVLVQGSAAHTIDFAKFRYAIVGLSVSGTDTTINDSDITNNATGISFGVTTSPNMARLNIENNGALGGGEYRWGATNGTGTAISALNLFWGATLGPNDADNAGSCTTNTSTGNAVRDTAANPINWCTFSPLRYNSLYNFAQYQSDGVTGVSVGGTVDSTTMVAKLFVDSFTTTGSLTLGVEVQPVGTPFTNTPNYTGSVTYSGVPVQGSVNVTGLSNSTSYHWQSRVCDATNLCSTWTSAGANSESATDFEVYFNEAPNSPTSLGPTNLVDGSTVNDETPTFTFSLSDPNLIDDLEYRIIIDDSSDFSSPIVDYLSDFVSQGSNSFTVGQAEGGGLYNVGADGQTLVDSNYYWKVLATDSSNQSSSYAIANSGNIAFIIQNLAPDIVAIVGPSDNVWQNDSTTPTLTWTDPNSLSGDTFYITTDGTTPTDSNYEFLETVASHTFTNLGSGIKLLKIRAKNGLGVYSTTLTYTYKYDNTVANVSGTSSSSTKNSITLNWSNPTDSESGFQKVKVQRSSIAFPSNVNADTTVYQGSLETFTDTGLENKTTYYYTIFVYDVVGNISSGTNLTDTTSKKDKEDDNNGIGDIVKDLDDKSKDIILDILAKRDGKVVPSAGGNYHFQPNDTVTVSFPIKDLDKNVLVVNIFVDNELYTMKLNKDHYEATFKSPKTLGDYSLNLLITYKNGSVQSQKFKMLIDPYGYVYTLNEEGSEVRVNHVEVYLYQIIDGVRTLWKDGLNPVVTNPQGEFKFVVAPGNYVLVANEIGFKPYESEVIVVTNTLVNKNIELKKKPKVFFTPEVQLMSAGFILLLTEAIAAQFGLLRGNIWSVFVSIMDKVKKRKPWGVVYDSLVKKNLSRAIIRLIDVETGRLVDTVVSDGLGIFKLAVKQGRYRLEINRFGYLFPSKAIIASSDGTNLNVYRGGPISINNESDTLMLSIPVDPEDVSSISIFKQALVNIFEQFVKYLSPILLLGGVVYSYYVYMNNQSQWNLILLATYILVLSVKTVLYLVKVKEVGRVVDENGNPIEGLELGLFESEFEKLEGRTTTDEKGEYNFIVPSKNYFIKSMDNNYKIVGEKIVVKEDKKSNIMLVTKDIKLS